MNKYSLRLVWQVPLFVLFCVGMMSFDTYGGPCGQGILVVFLFPFAATFGVLAIVNGVKLIRARRSGV